MLRSLKVLLLDDNAIGRDGLNELLKFMELTSNYLERVDMEGNRGYNEVREQYKLVCVLDVLTRNQYTTFEIVSLLVIIKVKLKSFEASALIFDDA